MQYVLPVLSLVTFACALILNLTNHTAATRWIYAAYITIMTPALIITFLM